MSAANTLTSRASAMQRCRPRDPAYYEIPIIILFERDPRQLQLFLTPHCLSVFVSPGSKPGSVFLFELYSQIVSQIYCQRQVIQKVFLVWGFVRIITRILLSAFLPLLYLHEITFQSFYDVWSEKQKGMVIQMRLRRDYRSPKKG